MTHLRKMLYSIQTVGLIVKVEKCKMGVAEVGYSDHGVERGCIKPEPARVEFKNCPTPQTQKSGTVLYWDGQILAEVVPH